MNLDQKPFGKHLFLNIFWWSFLHLILAWKPTGINSLQGSWNIACIIIHNTMGNAYLESIYAAFYSLQHYEPYYMWHIILYVPYFMETYMEQINYLFWKLFILFIWKFSFAQTVETKLFTKNIWKPLLRFLTLSNAWL